MTCRAARQLIFLQQHHVLPSRLREVIDDAGAGDATTDHDRARAIHLFAEPTRAEAAVLSPGAGRAAGPRQPPARYEAARPIPETTIRMLISVADHRRTALA